MLQARVDVIVRKKVRLESIYEGVGVDWKGVGVPDTRKLEDLGAAVVGEGVPGRVGGSMLRSVG